MNWFRRLVPAQIRIEGGGARGKVPQGVWIKCPACDAALYRAELERNLHVCPQCGHHMRMSARQRLDSFLDPDGREELDADLAPRDFLKFRDLKRYRDRLAQAQKATGEKDALVTMRGRLHGAPLVCAAFEFGFLGGSMGSVVGEKFARAAAVCADERLPLVCFAASGGARMQESLASLLQMSKTAAAVRRLRDAGPPYLAVLTDPTMGGVSASLGMLGDLQLAEPGALIGFAGPRVIEQTVRETLPEGFQRSEFLLEHGAVDMLVPRLELRDTIADLLNLMLDRPARERPA